MSKTFARPTPILDSEGELEELRLLVEISYSTAIPFAYPKRQESLRSMSLNMGCVFLDEKDPDFHILVEEGGEKGGERGEKLEEKGEEREKGGGGGGRGRPSDSGDPKIGTLVMGHTLIRSLVRWHRSLTHSLLSSWDRGIFLFNFLGDLNHCGGGEKGGGADGSKEGTGEGEEEGGGGGREKVIPCHKIVLAARSEYFRGLLNSGMKESQESKIKLKDFSCSLVRRMIDALYDGVWDDYLAEEAFALFPVADRFLLGDLRDFCIDVIKRDMKISDRFLFGDLQEFCIDVVKIDMKPSNVIDALVMAHTYNIPKLFKACAPVVKSHLEELRVHDDWSQLKDLGIMDKALDDSVSEDQESELFSDSDEHEYRVEEMLNKMSHDWKQIYTVVADGNSGLVAELVNSVEYFSMKT